VCVCVNDLRKKLMVNKYLLITEVNCHDTCERVIIK